MSKLLTVSIVLGFLSLHCIATEKKDSTENKNELSFSLHGYFMSIDLSYSRKLYKNRFIDFGIDYYFEHQKNLTKNESSYNTRTFGSHLTTDLGFIKHKTLNNNIELRYGFNFIYEYSYSELTIENPALPIDQRTSKNYLHLFGIGYKFGVFYQLNSNFSFGCMVNPYINFGQHINDHERNVYFGFMPTNASFGIIYKF